MPKPRRYGHRLEHIVSRGPGGEIKCSPEPDVERRSIAIQNAGRRWTLDDLRCREDGLRRYKAHRADAAHELRDAIENSRTVGIVYYIKFRDVVKIGTTRRPANRLGNLPWEYLLAIEPGGREIESERHETFRADWIQGEWFELSPALAEHLDQVRACHAAWVQNVYLAPDPLPWSRKETAFPEVPYPSIC